MIRLLRPADVLWMEGMLTMFGEAFEDVETYSGKRPSREYLQKLMGSDQFVALAAIADETVVGGIAAYELKKFEQERSEIYIYDLAVAESYRRQGIASALIEELRKVAAARRAYVIFVQADPPDAPARALYEKFGRREEVLHYDIDPK